MPTDPDSSILNFTVDDNQGNTLQAITAMTRTGVGSYTGMFTVTAAMNETDVVVFFNYSISSVAYKQVRTSKITSTATDSANIAAIKAKTDNLPADPASNTVVNTRASQTSVNAIPTNPLLTTDSRLNNIDATISSRATQTSVNAIPTNPLLTTDSRLNNLANLDATVSSRATQTSVNAIPTNPLLTTDSRLNNLDAAISSRASQTTLDSYFGNMSTLATNLTSVTTTLTADVTTLNEGIATVDSDIGQCVTAANTALTAANTAEAAATAIDEGITTLNNDIAGLETATENLNNSATVLATSNLGGAVSEADVLVGSV